jgi:outer membrane protein assembly factor BamA
VGHRALPKKNAAAGNCGAFFIGPHLECASSDLFRRSKGRIRRRNPTASFKGGNDNIGLPLLQQNFGISNGITMPTTLIKGLNPTKSVNQKTTTKNGSKTKSDTCLTSELELGIQPDNRNN